MSAFFISFNLLLPEFCRYWPQRSDSRTIPRVSGKTIKGRLATIFIIQWVSRIQINAINAMRVYFIKPSHSSLPYDHYCHSIIRHILCCFECQSYTCAAVIRNGDFRESSESPDSRSGAALKIEGLKVNLYGLLSGSKSTAIRSASGQYLLSSGVALTS
ncbi:Uncharacterised protein [Raoultella terrigena]|uniref:Uncharacterized protein n=1 Tax=Raoultella terrigena TaxID=577 RepID=A0A4U9CYB4_RAOTE|nr:Uncharacterised protein [Raoultella terrigena]